MQTETDANRALSEIYEKSMKEKSLKIFAENIYVTILVPKSMRNEIKAKVDRQAPMPYFKMPPGGSELLPPGPRPQVPYNPNRKQDQ
jgi:hypothetical protein